MDGAKDGFLLGLTLLLAVITAALLIVRFWLIGLVMGLGFVIVVMIRDNLREVLR